MVSLIIMIMRSISAMSVPSFHSQYTVNTVNCQEGVLKGVKKCGNRCKPTCGSRLE